MQVCYAFVVFVIGSAFLSIFKKKIILGRVDEAIFAETGANLVLGYYYAKLDLQ